MCSVHARHAASTTVVHYVGRYYLSVGFSTGAKHATLQSCARTQATSAKQRFRRKAHHARRRRWLGFVARSLARRLACSQACLLGGDVLCWIFLIEILFHFFFFNVVYGHHAAAALCLSVRLLCSLFCVCLICSALAGGHEREAVLGRVVPHGGGVLPRLPGKRAGYMSSSSGCILFLSCSCFCLLCRRARRRPGPYRSPLSVPADTSLQHHRRCC